MERRVSVDQSSQAYVPAFVDRIVRPLTRVLNPLIMRFAGGWWFPMFSVLHHRGHRSGRMYATPVSAMPRGGYFWLGCSFTGGACLSWLREQLGGSFEELVAEAETAPPGCEGLFFLPWLEGAAM